MRARIEGNGMIEEWTDGMDGKRKKREDGGEYNRLPPMYLNSGLFLGYLGLPNILI